MLSVGYYIRKVDVAPHLQVVLIGDAEPLLSRRELIGRLCGLGEGGGTSRLGRLDSLARHA